MATSKATIKCRAVVAVVMVLGAGIAWASGDWSYARNAADYFKSKQQDLLKLAPGETRRIVKAICDADQDNRREAGRDISQRVASELNGKLPDLEKARDEANKRLDEVINDDKLKDNRDDAKRLKEDIASRWDSVERMTRSLRGANHPVVAFMLDQGQQAHKDRQERECHASEVALPSGRADCLMATGETCLVVELKPNNSNAISKGRDQVRDYASDLNAELKNPNSSIIKKLVDTKSDFAKCKKFEQRVDCYRLCPDIGDDNEFREIRVDWSKGC